MICLMGKDNSKKKMIWSLVLKMILNSRALLTLGIWLKVKMHILKASSIELLVPKDDELKHRTLRLVPEQMNILRKVCHYCRDVVKAKKKLGHKVKPLRLIIHGGAGENFSLVIMEST